MSSSVLFFYFTFETKQQKSFFFNLIQFFEPFLYTVYTETVFAHPLKIFSYLELLQIFAFAYFLHCLYTLSKPGVGKV